jgi:hypothetical protein
LQLLPEEIEEFLQGYKNDVKASINEIVELVVFSEVLDYNQAWYMSRLEIEIFMDALKSKADAKSGKKRNQNL